MRGKPLWCNPRCCTPVLLVDVGGEISKAEGVNVVLQLYSKSIIVSKVRLIVLGKHKNKNPKSSNVTSEIA